MAKLSGSTHWNPWHGCHKVSTGCKNCYMFNLDNMRGLADSETVRKTGQFHLPLKKHRDGTFVIPKHSEVMVCMTSDFFIEEADEFRESAWNMIKYRSDVLFQLLTKRPERISKVLPSWWKDGLSNVWLNVSTENQEMADLRIPILLDLPFKHKGIMAAPMISQIDIRKYLKDNKIDAVAVSGENYDGARPFNYDWGKDLMEQCIEANTNFSLFETGTHFIKDGKTYNIPPRQQKAQARKSNLHFEGREIILDLNGAGGQELFF